MYNNIILPVDYQYYTSIEEEVILAKEMVELAEEAAWEGKVVAVKDIKFIGLSMVRMAKNVLA